jgi:hypothetical protein
MESLDRIALIAPCGMNCGICRAYLRERNKCSGCRGADAGKPVTLLRCKIRTCEVFQEGKAKYCFECGNFPCDSLKHLDKRYRTKYSMSMIENLGNIKVPGVREFLANEDSRWTCLECGGTVCVHKACCSVCGAKKQAMRLYT